MSKIKVTYVYSDIGPRSWYFTEENFPDVTLVTVNHPMVVSVTVEKIERG